MSMPIFHPPTDPGVLHPTSGFVELGLLLERLEAEAQLPLVEQPTWTQPRLKKAGSFWGGLGCVRVG